ncbi:hypothetical protein DPMN_162532 [Dreissena polymorpha]|uniref:Uncharacterized protein n=1 Tax=Dreissena polymorpha TaxID=45954 RepID=A0A9D4ESG2_DREPO|nr:hypothetical protein DPMN_162532 [Dreissena polymorpha]
MKLLLVGLLGIVLVWSSQTTANKEDFTNDELLEAEVRANKKSLEDEYADLQAVCGDECFGEEGDDFTECVDRCEQRDDVSDDSDDDDDRKDGDGGKDGDDGGDGDDGIDDDHYDAGDDGDGGNEDNDGDDGIADVARANGEKRVPIFERWSFGRRHGN